MPACPFFQFCFKGKTNKVYHGEYKWWINYKIFKFKKYTHVSLTQNKLILKHPDLIKLSNWQPQAFP